MLLRQFPEHSKDFSSALMKVLQRRLYCCTKLLYCCQLAIYLLLFFSESFMQYIKQHPIKIEYSKKYDKEDNLINIGNIIAELISVKTVKYV